MSGVNRCTTSRARYVVGVLPVLVMLPVALAVAITVLPVESLCQTPPCPWGVGGWMGGWPTTMRRPPGRRGGAGGPPYLSAQPWRLLPAICACQCDHPPILDGGLYDGQRDSERLGQLPVQVDRDSPGAGAANWGSLGDGCFRANLAIEAGGT